MMSQLYCLYVYTPAVYKKNYIPWAPVSGIWLVDFVLNVSFVHLLLKYIYVIPLYMNKMQMARYTVLILCNKASVGVNIPIRHYCSLSVFGFWLPESIKVMSGILLS